MINDSGIGFVIRKRMNGVTNDLELLVLIGSLLFGRYPIDKTPSPCNNRSRVVGGGWST